MSTDRISSTVNLLYAAISSAIRLLRNRTSRPISVSLTVSGRRLLLGLLLLVIRPSGVPLNWLGSMLKYRVLVYGSVSPPTSAYDARSLPNVNQLLAPSMSSLNTKLALADG